MPKPIKMNKRIPSFANSSPDEAISNTRISPVAEPPVVSRVGIDGGEQVADETQLSPVQEILSTLDEQEKQELFTLLQAEMAAKTEPSIPMDDDDEGEEMI